MIRHVCRSVQLAEDVLKYSKVDFYKGIASITMSFVKLEKEMTNELIEEVKEDSSNLR